jgi:hypothetical protein
MAITQLNNHDQHAVRIHLTRGGKHYAALRCVPCSKHIQWLSRQDTQSLNELGVEMWSFLTPEELAQERRTK